LFHMQRPRDVTILTDAAQSGERTAKWTASDEQQIHSLLVRQWGKQQVS
jgi:hypothetical protein